MTGAAGQHKQVPDAMTPRPALIEGVTGQPDGIENTVRHQPAQPITR